MQRAEGRASFRSRLLREGRYDEFRVAQDKARKEQGISQEQAFALLRPQFPPTGQFTPTGSLPAPAATAWGEEEDLGFLAMLTWVSGALGRSEAGESITAAQSPGPRSWGLFQWARKSKRDFYTLWAGEARRHSADSSVSKNSKAAKLAIEEIDEMLAGLASGRTTDSPHHQPVSV